MNVVQAARDEQISAAYQRLGHAVVEIACNDYMQGMKKLKRDEEMSDEETKNLSDSEIFFSSELPEVFSGVDGNRLRELCDDKVRRDLAASAARKDKHGSRV